MTISSPVGAREGSDLDSIGKRLEWFTVDMMRAETEEDEDRNLVCRRSKKDFDKFGVENSGLRHCHYHPSRSRPLASSE